MVVFCVSNQAICGKTQLLISICSHFQHLSAHDGLLLLHHSVAKAPLHRSLGPHSALPPPVLQFYDEVRSHSRLSSYFLFRLVIMLVISFHLISRPFPHPIWQKLNLNVPETMLDRSLHQPLHFIAKRCGICVYKMTVIVGRLLEVTPDAHAS